MNKYLKGFINGDNLESILPRFGSLLFIVLTIGATFSFNKSSYLCFISIFGIVIIGIVTLRLILKVVYHEFTEFVKCRLLNIKHYKVCIGIRIALLCILSIMSIRVIYNPMYSINNLYNDFDKNVVNAIICLEGYLPKPFIGGFYMFNDILCVLHELSDEVDDVDNLTEDEKISLQNKYESIAFEIENSFNSYKTYVIVYIVLLIADDILWRISNVLIFKKNKGSNN